MRYVGVVVLIVVMSCGTPPQRVMQAQCPLCKALLDAGAARVDVYCLARTPKPGGA